MAAAETVTFGVKICFEGRSQIDHDNCMILLFGSMGMESVTKSFLIPVTLVSSQESVTCNYSMKQM